MHTLYPIQTLRAIEQAMYKLPGLGEYPLMHRAGVAAFNQMQAHWSEAKTINIFLGKGNNAGDGIVIAGLAQMRGLKVNIYTLYDMNEFSETSKEALDDLTHSLANVQSFDAHTVEPCDLIVDAILGIGVQGAVRSPALEAIEWINESEAPVLSIDVPSGLNADTGEVANCAVRADKTVTFLGLKPGFYTCDGQDHTGEVILETLDCPPKPSPFKVMTEVSDPRSPRKQNSHKGDYGRLLIIGGNPNMGGAVLLAADEAIALGAGLVKVACAEKHHPAIISQVPEVLTYDYEQDLSELMAEATVIAIGPGLGLDAKAEAVFEKVIATDKPLIIDASALTLLANKQHKSDNWILTPHPGEAAQLLGTDSESVQHDRWHAARKIHERYGGVVVLKGSGTIIYNGDESHVCPFGDPWMAQAGQGDRLTGIIASLVAQGVAHYEAANYGVYLHATN